ncbi:hypothetical protein C0J52_20330 [Blattella germanica]|nr:hypothetical protein C0J52_20330 [Blattella germanica]
MDSIRKWFYKPKRDDPSLLAQFFYADEALNIVAAELDSFDGRKDPERCTALVLTICNRIMDDVIPTERANRDFRVKFPDDVMQENLAGQLWFGAECLAAGSSIMNREGESSAMRPLAKALTKALENVRNLLREQCLRGNTSNSSLKLALNSGPNEIFGERLQEALKIFDRLFAEFELSYVSAMVPVKSTKEYELQQLVVVLFSETLQRALKMKLLSQEMVDDYDPALMFTIPRLAIVSGLLIFPDGPLCLDRTPSDMSEMFRPFRTLLNKIRELLWTLNKKELFTLEKLLCSSEEPGDFHSQGQQINIYNISDSGTSVNATSSYPTVPDLDDFVTRFYIDYPSCKQFVKDFYDSTTVQCTDAGNAQDSCSSKANKNSTENNTLIEKTENDSQNHVVAPSWESTSESEEETEWVGETSESDTIVTDACNELEETGGSLEGEIKITREEFLHKNSMPQTSHGNSALPHQPGLKELAVFGEHINPEDESEMLSSSHSSYISFHGQGSLQLESQTFTTRLRGNSENPQDPENFGHLSYTEAMVIPTPNVSGFLLANQVGHESMLASVERIPGPRMPDLSPVTGESSSEGDAREALSVATATLSTLLFSSPNLSPVRGFQGNDMEEDSSVHSPFDSGLGTVVTCSETGSFSDRSPDIAGAITNINESKHLETDIEGSRNSNISPETSKKQTFPKQWEVETIPCNCSVGDKSLKYSIVRGVNKLENITTRTDEGCQSTSKCKMHFMTGCEICSVNICDNISESANNSMKSVACKDCLLPLETEVFGNGDQILSRPCHMCVKHSCCTSEEGLKCDLNEVPIGEVTQNSNSLHNSSIVVCVNSSHNCSKIEAQNCVICEEEKTENSTDFGSLTVKESTQLSESHNLIGTSNEHKTIVPSIVLENEGSNIEMLEESNREELCVHCTVSGTGEVQNLSHSSNSKSCLENKSECYNWDSNVNSIGPENSVTVSCYSDNEPLEKNKTAERRKSNNVVNTSLSSVVQCMSSMPGQTGRNLEVPLGSSYSSTNSSCQSSVTASSDRSSEDLVHRLFVCIAGVADQLQTNFAGDLRHILKCVFLMSATSTSKSEDDDLEDSPVISESVEVDQLSPEGGDNGSDLLRAVENAEEALSSGWESPTSPAEVESPPPWVFCGRCSSNSVPLPRYGHVKPVRVCNRCFFYQVSPFTLQELATRS